MGVCIQTGWIVWKNGPYPCGAYPDLKITRERLVFEFDRGEMYVADRGYRDGRLLALTPSGYNSPFESMMSEARARHETVNCRLKSFKILSTPFRNEINKHWMCFHAITNMVQLELENDRPLYQVHYDDKDQL